MHSAATFLVGDDVAADGLGVPPLGHFSGECGGDFGVVGVIGEVDQLIRIRLQVKQLRRIDFTSIVLELAAPDHEHRPARRTFSAMLAHRFAVVLTARHQRHQRAPVHRGAEVSSPCQFDKGRRNIDQ